MLILVCRKIISTFYLILHENFSNSYGFPLMQEFNAIYPRLVLYDRKHFCPILIDLSNLLLLLHPKFHFLSYGLKNVLTKQFPKMQKQPFTNVLQKQSPREISQDSQENTHARVSLLIKLKAPTSACNFIKKETLA